MRIERHGEEWHIWHSSMLTRPYRIRNVNEKTFEMFGTLSKKWWPCERSDALAPFWQDALNAILNYETRVF